MWVCWPLMLCFIYLKLTLQMWNTSEWIYITPFAYPDRVSPILCWYIKGRNFIWRLVVWTCFNCFVRFWKLPWWLYPKSSFQCYICNVPIPTKCRLLEMRDQRKRFYLKAYSMELWNCLLDFGNLHDDSIQKNYRFIAKYVKVLIATRIWVLEMGDQNFLEW